MKILQCLILLIFCSSVYPQLSGAEKFAKSITQKELKEHLYIYASDEFEGRETGSEGQKKAVNYIRDFYIKNKIQPGDPDSDYFKYLNKSVKQ